MRSRKIFSMLGLMSLLIIPGFMNQKQQDPFLSFNLEFNSSGSVYVQWKTTGVYTNMYTEVQRSSDLKTWSCIHTLSPQLQTQFNYFDINPSNGVNYYRIKLTNESNEIFYSGVRQIELINTSDCYLWPQPATNILHVEVPFSYGTVEIIDALGRTYQRTSLTGFRSQITIEQLPKGIYFARIKNENKVWLQKFIKQ